DALDDLALRAADNRAGVVEGRRKAVLARNDEPSLDGRSLPDRLESAIELGHRRAVEALLEPAEIAPRRRHLGHHQIQPALELQQLSAQAGPRCQRPRQPEHRLGLVKVTECLDSWIGLAHALLAEERRLAAIAGA